MVAELAAGEETFQLRSPTRGRTRTKKQSTENKLAYGLDSYSHRYLLSVHQIKLMVFR